MPRALGNTSVASEDWWRVVRGRIVRGPGAPGKEQLFRVVAEKIPFGALNEIGRDLIKERLPRGGVYMLHDSMGSPRYAGLSRNVITRLAAHHRQFPHELPYFSFYTGLSPKHQKEIETVLVRAVGSAGINQYKTANGSEPGSLRGFAPGTIFYQRRKLRVARKRRGRNARS